MQDTLAHGQNTMENMINNALGFSRHYASEPSVSHVFEDEDDGNDGN